MGLFDGLLGSAENINLGDLAAKVGLNEDQLKQGGEALMAKLAAGHDPEAAATAASAETGVDAGALSSLLPALADKFGHADTGGLLSSLTGEGGMLSKLGDSAGGITGQIGGFAKGLFGSKE